MAFLEWLEYSALGEWVAASEWGYAIAISCHGIGLGIVVGTLAMVDLRIVGVLKRLELAPMCGLINLAWAGFVVNAISGFALFASQATYFIGHIAFLVKISAILLAVVNAAFLQNALRASADKWDEGETISGSAKLLALGSLVLWSVAIVAGRLIAYL